MKKVMLALAGVMMLAACGAVTVKDGNRECTTTTLGLLGLSLGAPLNNGCK